MGPLHFLYPRRAGLARDHLRPADYRGQFLNVLADTLDLVLVNGDAGRVASTTASCRSGRAGIETGDKRLPPGSRSLLLRGSGTVDVAMSCET